MSKQIKTIKQCYKALEYEINKQESLKKISTLHYELKFKDTNDFSDRFSQTACIIEKNLPVFKSACDHVDVITSILDFLHTISAGLMFNNKCTPDGVSIIYIMYIICGEREIPSFLKAALINNSGLEYIDNYYGPLISNYVYEMIVLEDSDLYAIISYLRITPISQKINKIFIQESVEQKFVSLLEKYIKQSYPGLDLLISTFHTKKELHSFPSYLESLASINMVSIWSEDIAAAKVLATTLRRDITFINSHLELCTNITLSWKWSSSVFNLFRYHVWNDSKDGDKINPNKHIGLIYDLFYNGVWQKPVKNGYWIHNGNTYACATQEDVTICIKSAEEAYKNWSLLPIFSRRKILENLASALECNGKILFKNIVLASIKISNINNILKFQDERLEIIGFHGPKGVVSVSHQNEVALFTHLTLSLILGNCVIVLHNKNSCTLAPYFNMFSTAEIPPGVVNLLSNRDICNLFNTEDYKLNDVVKYCTSINHIILSLK